MLVANYIFTVLNFICFIIAGYIYFNRNYEILPKDVYQVLADTYEKTMKEEESKQELAGGTGVEVGFGAAYLEDEEEEDE